MAHSLESAGSPAPSGNGGAPALPSSLEDGLGSAVADNALPQGPRARLASFALLDIGCLALRLRHEEDDDPATGRALMDAIRSRIDTLAKLGSWALDDQFASVDDLVNQAYPNDERTRRLILGGVQ